MHPRLRRQLLGVPGEVPRKLLDAVEAAYREADEERELLETSLASITALLQRAQQAQAAGEERKSARRARAAKAAKKLAKALAKSGTAVFELAPDLTVRAANAAALKICGDGAEGVGLFTVLEPLQAEAVAEKWRGRLERGEPVAQKLACSTRDKTALACDFVCVPRLRKDGKLLGATAVLRNETERLEAQETVREREERMSLALASTSDVLWDWDLRSGRLHLSSRWREVLGVAPQSGLPGEWFDRVHAEDLAPLRAAIAAAAEGRAPGVEHEHRVRHADGEFRWMLVRGAAVRDATGTAVRLSGLMSDVTRNRRLVERMAHDARHDALTGLPNRTLFLDLLRHSFNRTRRHEDYRFGVLFIDIDRFKMVNDAFGHEAGDQLLAQITRRLESCLREGDTLARHGGDEFTMWLDDVRGPTDAVRVAERVHEVMREPFELGAQRVNSSASIGVAIGSSSYKSAEDVLRDADVAMYRAKAMGKSRTAVFQGETAQLQLETDLRSALLRNELRVHYMPIVEVATGKLQGLEALARWQHPRLGLVQPAKFLQVAVETGLVVSLDQWVLQTASRQLHEWRGELREASRLTMSVNFSQKLLEQDDLGEQVDKVLRDTQLAPGDLNVDVSESASGVDARLAELHQRGLGLHMDDFGTGQAWLRHLYASEVDSVKIDRSFVAAGGGSDRQILKRIVSIARDTGKKVIAEGVETAEQFRFIKEIGCDSAQGYFFAPPVDGAKARSLLQTG